MKSATYKLKQPKHSTTSILQHATCLQLLQWQTWLGCGLHSCCLYNAVYFSVSSDNVNSDRQLRMSQSTAIACC